MPFLKQPQPVLLTNVVCLHSESVPDAERFYDNPRADAPEYHVLEHPTEEAQSYGELYHPRLKDHNLEHAQSSGDFTSDVNHCVIIDNDVIDEPVYANSPAIVSNNSQENKFSFDVSDDNFVDQESINYETKEDDNDVYANSEALRSSYSDIQSAHNDAYEDDDDASHSNEPIYDNHSIMNNTSGSGGSPLLTNQSHQAIYQDLKSTQAQESDYQALTPVTDRNTNQIKPKPKPRQRNKRPQFEFQNARSLCGGFDESERLSIYVYVIKQKVRQRASPLFPPKSINNGKRGLPMAAA